MKTGIISSPTIASEGLEKSKMGMSAKGMDIASYFLRDKIYSNKPLAVVREYICNAIDEHKKHSIAKNVDVKIDRDEDGNVIWSVRDYANGLSEHDVRNIFGMYFESTKAGDNDSIGGFGIGSKAGHCYSDTFYVTSYFEGTETVYACVLGAGPKGVPVGEIFAVSSGPTTESGIEISIDVTKDAYIFHNCTTTMIRCFPPDVAITLISPLYGDKNPDVPIHIEIIGDYTFSAYNRHEFSSPYYSNTLIYIRIGGVIYACNTQKIYTRGGNIKNPIVIDVPIGNLTLPISRESIENTPNNEKELQEIANAYSKLVELDKENLKVPSMAQSLVESRWSLVEKEYSANWFTYELRTLYPNTYRFKNSVSYNLTYDKSHIDANGKQVIYILPSIKNQNSWKTRLITFLNSGSTSTIPPQFLYATEGVLDQYLDKEDIDLTDVVLVNVKKLGLPKIPTISKGPQTQYACYMKGVCHTYSPDELLARAEKDTGAFVDGWEATVDKMTTVNFRTIASTIGYGQSRSFWTANSEKFIKAMVEKGFIIGGSDEYNAIVTRIQDEIAKKQEKINAKHNINYNYMSVDRSKHLENALVNKPDRLKKLTKILGNICREKTIRGRLINNMTLTQWGDGAKFKRSDIRAILRLKDS